MTTNDNANAELRIRMTIITSDHGPINKTITVGPDGKPEANSDSCRVWSGKVVASEPLSMAGFAENVGD